MSPGKPIRMSRHAIEQCMLRGTDEREVRLAIERGQRKAVREGRWMYRYNVPLNAEWQGKHCAIKQVAPVVVEKPTVIIVVTVYTFYF